MKFEARFPIDHVIKLVQLLRSGEFRRGELLQLAAVILGEIGALLESGFVLPGVQTAADSMTEAECLDSLATLETTAQDANFDPGIWIPIIIRLIELWLSRR